VLSKAQEERLKWLFEESQATGEAAVALMVLATQLRRKNHDWN
jgi:hypothetical protein